MAKKLHKGKRKKKISWHNQYIIIPLLLLVAILSLTFLLNDRLGIVGNVVSDAADTPLINLPPEEQIVLKEQIGDYYDLADYPAPFIDNKCNFNADLVVGSENNGEIANADISLVGDIITGLKSFCPGIKFFGATLDKKAMGIMDRNIILIGNPCTNSAVKELLGTSSCDGGGLFREGKATMKAFVNNNHVQLVVGSLHEEDVTIASNYFKNPRSTMVKGTEVVLGQ